MLTRLYKTLCWHINCTVHLRKKKKKVFSPPFSLSSIYLRNWQIDRMSSFVFLWLDIFIFAHNLCAARVWTKSVWSTIAGASCTPFFHLQSLFAQPLLCLVVRYLALMASSIISFFVFSEDGCASPLHYSALSVCCCLVRLEVRDAGYSRCHGGKKFIFHFLQRM